MSTIDVEVVCLPAGATGTMTTTMTAGDDILINHLPYYL
jgi:hypothetical protein